LKRLDKELVLDAARDRELASIFSRKSMYGADKYVFLGKATATRKEKAEIAASKVALDYLQEVYDINRNTAEQVKLEIIGEREPDELQYLKSIYSDITFPSAQIYGDKAYYYITGVRNKKRINITIYTTSPHINFNTARTNLIEKAYRKVKKQAELTE
jgi:hypothetical protein